MATTAGGGAGNSKRAMSKAVAAGGDAAWRAKASAATKRLKSTPKAPPKPKPGAKPLTQAQLMKGNFVPSVKLDASQITDNRYLGAGHRRSVTSSLLSQRRKRGVPGTRTPGPYGNVK